MRRVKVFKKVLLAKACKENKYITAYAEQLDYQGYFHGIGNEGAIDEDGGEMFMVAAIEDMEGQMHIPLLSNVRFLDPPQEQNTTLANLEKSQKDNEIRYLTPNGLAKLTAKLGSL